MYYYFLKRRHPFKYFNIVLFIIYTWLYMSNNEPMIENTSINISYPLLCLRISGTIYLSIEHIQKVVLDDKAPLSGHYPSPPALHPLSQDRMCLYS